MLLAAAMLIGSHVLTGMVGVTLIAAAVFLSYRFSSRLIDYLGETGTAVFLRLSSFHLAVHRGRHHLERARRSDT